MLDTVLNLDLESHCNSTYVARPAVLSMLSHVGLLIVTSKPFLRMSHEATSLWYRKIDKFKNAFG